MPGKSGKKSGQRKRRKAGQGQRPAADPSAEKTVEPRELSAAVDAPGSVDSPDAPTDGGGENRSVSDVSVEHNAPAVSLREAREALGISVDDVVRELNLSREVVLGLEAGDYEFLGAPVFVKGHLRRYARYLDVPEAALLADLQSREPEPEEFRTLSRPRELKTGASLSNFVLWGMLFLLLFFGIGYLLLGDDEPAAPAAVDLPAPVPERRSAGQDGPGRYERKAAESPVESAADFEASPVADSGPGPGEPDSERATEIAAVSMPAGQAAAEAEAGEPVDTGPAPQPLAATSMATLVMRFSADCWVEVTDSNGKLIFGLQEAGSEASANATLPVSLLLGNAAGVTLEVAGLSWDIPRNNRGRSRTARFRIDSAALAAAKAELQ